MTRFTCAFLLAVLFGALPAFAQLSIPGAESALRIAVLPPYPAPGARVALTLQSTLYDLTNSQITWTLNGKPLAQGEGLTDTSVTMGARGTEARIAASISGENGTASAAVALVPSSIDLLWESDSYVPPLYKGRALPAAGSNVTLVALPQFSRPGGDAIAADTLSYTWKKDGDAIPGAGGKGKSSLVIDGPTLFGTETISVIATTPDNRVSGQALVKIADMGTQLALYEKHPLYGVLYHRALGARTFIPETEVSFAAVPYFAPVRSANDAQLEYAWRVNESDVKSDAQRPGEITINAEKSSGVALIRLALAHVTNFFLSADGAWGVTFTQSGTVFGAQDPFSQ